jgi:diguanylate cyclase (GGDEF)-like protein
MSPSRAPSQKLAYLAHHDALTDLPNRVLFQDRVDRACQFGLRHHGRFAVVFMDLDHFKHVNDSLGYAAGDELLKIVARRLQATLRGSDTVCRLGGDEFVMLLTDIRSTQDAGEVATKILRNVAMPSMLHGTEVNVGMSLGIATPPDDGEDPEALTKHADVAKYRSKRVGHNRFEFFSRVVDRSGFGAPAPRSRHPSGSGRGPVRRSFPADRRRHQWSTGRLEALARWMRPGVGPQNSAVFIPVAEECGLIVPLGESMLRQACAQLNAWRDTPLGSITMSVNVSPVQFAQANFTERVAQILADTGVWGPQLEFESTESTLMYDSEATLGLLRRIKAIVVMSRSLRLRVVAEGVETEAQAELLAAMDCTALQGFLYARPADAASVGDWVRARLVPLVTMRTG